MCIAQLPGAVEYTDYTSAKGWDLNNKCPGYDTKQSDSKIPMQSTASLPLLPGPLWPIMVALDRALSMG